MLPHSRKVMMLVDFPRRRLGSKTVRPRIASARLACAAAPMIIAALALSASGETVHVQFEGGKLSLAARAATVADVLKAIADKTGVRFVVDAEVKPGPITIDLDAMPLERAIHNLLTVIPQAAGHSMTYARDPRGEPLLVQVTLFGPGKTPAEGGATVYSASERLATPVVVATPDLEAGKDKMIQAGVERQTAERVINLTRDVQNLQVTPVPGSYRPEDLSPASREQLQPLLDRGVPVERAVQMLLLQERYQQTLKKLQSIQAGKTPVPRPTPPAR
jgi:hypothetical protein